MTGCWRGYWYFIIKKPALSPHRARPEGRIVLITVPHGARPVHLIKLPWLQCDRLLEEAGRRGHHGKDSHAVVCREVSARTGVPRS